MSTLNINQAVSMGDGAIIPSLGPVTFKSIFPPRSGIGKQSGEPYTVQDAVLSDGTGDVRAAIWDAADLSALRGSTRVIHSVKAKNGRLAGVAVKVGKDKEGNNRWEIHISHSALIVDGEVASVTPPPAQATPFTAAVPARQEPADPGQQPSEKKPKASPGEPAAPDKLDDVVTLFNRCYAEARDILRASEDHIQSYEGYLPALQAAAATLFIAARQEGLTTGAARRYPCCSPKVEKDAEQPF
jgi:hypothetical protein